MIKDKKNITEESLVESAFERMREQNYAVFRDVPLLDRCVDLIQITSTLIISYEFKLRDWKRAVIQARDHKLGADYAYICMLERSITEEMHAEISAAGVGLVFFCDKGDWPFEIVVRAPKSKEVWRPAKRNLKSFIETNEDCDTKNSFR